MKKLLIWDSKGILKHILIELNNITNKDEILSATTDNGFYKYNSLRISDKKAFEVLINSIINKINDEIRNHRNEIAKLCKRRDLYIGAKS